MYRMQYLSKAMEEYLGHVKITADLYGLDRTGVSGSHNRLSRLPTFGPLANLDRKLHP